MGRGGEVRGREGDVRRTLFPSPRSSRGEGGETRSGEPGEGQTCHCEKPLTRLAALGTLSPFHGERESVRLNPS